LLVYAVGEYVTTYKVKTAAQRKEIVIFIEGYMAAIDDCKKIIDEN